MNDEEINNAFLNKSKELGINTMSLTCNAPIKNFPGKIYYGVKPASSSFSTPYYYSDVMTSAGETLCDVELWFNTTRTKIYGTNSATRLLYNTYFSGVLSTRSSGVGGQSVVIGGTRMVLAGLTSYGVYSHTITWNKKVKLILLFYFFIYNLRALQGSLIIALVINGVITFIF